MSILKMIRPELLYKGFETQAKVEAPCRLHANELPWSPLDQQEVNYNYYPDMDLQTKLQSQLADIYQINSDQLVLTRGSDDGIDLLTRLFLTARQDALMQFPPTFSMYEFYVRLQQAELIQCPLDESQGFNLTLQQITQAWQPNCKMIMFCRPNNPTGNLLSLDLIKATCELYANQSVIVVDEAYIEFSKADSATRLLAQYENLIVLRTMSKAYGLAGLRIGCILAQTSVIQAVKQITAPYAISRASVELLSQALKNKEWFSQAIERILSARNWLVGQLKSLDLFDEIYPSETNFILLKTTFAKQLSYWLSQKGIAARDFPRNSQLHQHLRITVGDEAHNQLLIDALTSFSL